MGARTHRIYRLNRTLGRLTPGMIVAIWLWSGVAQAVGQPGGQMICERAGMIAARERGIPGTVLRAITRTETGRARQGRLSSWPWTSNVAGKGYWFDSKDEALQFLRDQVARGQRNFDVGCFQINYRWHHQAFDSLDTMIDPMTNARYAARFLTDLHAEKGNWSDAVGAYHSRTPRYANRYLKTYKAHYTAIAAGHEGAPAAQDAAPQMSTPARRSEKARVNTYPLFVSHGSTDTVARAGSLVALSMSGGGRPFLSMPGAAGRGAAE